MPSITIDKRSIEVPAGTKVIEAAERLGIMIPRFCYHPALGSVGACRVCAVQFLEGPVKGIQMSCMISAQDGMVISTTDDEAVDFRRHVIEWLMLNHPHDCPVCDEGGHCLLQDLTVSGNHGLRRYQGKKRTHRDQYLGPLVQHEMNRCIQCYRCARYYQEFSGYRDLGVMGIGSRVYFGRSVPGRLESPFSGNLIDICPTGVYTDKPSRFTGRRWDFERAPSICLHCSLGCNLVASARYRQVVRHEARLNANVNGYFICDRGRYAYPYASSPLRPRQALVEGRAAPLENALQTAQGRLAQIVKQHGGQAVAVVGSVRSNLETLAVLHQVCRRHDWQGPVCEIDPQRAANLRAVVQRLEPDLAISLGAVTAADHVLILGVDPLNEAPMLALSLRQAQRQGARITVIDPRSVEMPFDFEHLALHPDQWDGLIQRMMLDIYTPERAATLGQNSQTYFAALGNAPAAPPAGGLDLQGLAAQPGVAQRMVLVCGTDLARPSTIHLAADLVLLQRAAGIESKLFFTLSGANALGTALLPDTGIDFDELLTAVENGRIKALVVVENDLWNACAHRQRLQQALKGLELLVVLDYLDSPLNARASVFLPTQTIYETGGQWINQEGRLQRAQAVYAGGESIAMTGNGDHPPRVFGSSVPGGEPQPAWQMAAALEDSRIAPNPGIIEQALAALHLSFGAAADQRVVLKPDTEARFTQRVPPMPEGDAEAGQSMLQLVEWTIGTEALAALSPALQEVEPAPTASLHPKEAERLGVTHGGQMTISTPSGRLTVTVKTDPRMAPGIVVLPRHRRLDWQELGATRMSLAADCFRAQNGSTHG